MREFYLMNADGATWNLTDKNTTFLHSVTGLGYDYEQETQQFGNHYETLYEVLRQKELSGPVYFNKEDNENNYHNFVRFCQNKPLTLVYKPGNEEYQIKGSVASVEKSEANTLTANITFKGATPWYKVIRTINNGSISDVGGYPYTYDFTYPDEAPQTLAIMSDSFTESPVKLEIFGPAQNPTWQQYINNVLTTIGKVNISVPANRKLVIDTTGKQPSIKVMDLSNRLVLDAYGFSDFSTKRFMALQHGQNRITVSHDGTNVIKVAAEGRIEYASV